MAERAISTLSLLTVITLSTLPIMDQTVKVGAVQAEPVWLDLEGSVDKTISLIEKAAADGVQVLGFPEVWIPGYPWYDRNLSARMVSSTMYP